MLARKGGRKPEYPERTQVTKRATTIPYQLVWWAVRIANIVQNAWTPDTFNGNILYFNLSVIHKKTQVTTKVNILLFTTQNLSELEFRCEKDIVAL